ncbi:uncharacterized protein LOC141651292 [Silene latifolia]|uniref:uncharacterized protein LOC141651292 n=1 Tax=Silene latifolia TaxID=37657 RepID=UPI003D788D64
MLYHVNLVSKSLQSKDVFIDVAIKEMKGLVTFFEEFRETGLENAIEEAKKIALEININPVFPQRRVIRRKRQFDENQNMTHQWFEKYKEFENVFGFLFTSERLLSMEYTRLKLCCIGFEDAHKKDEQADLNGTDLYMELKIMLTIPVTVASVLRSFSKLRLFKSYLRTTMSQERLNGLALIAIENDILERLEYKDIINVFASQNARMPAIFKLD